MKVTEEQVKKALAVGRDTYVKRMLDSLREVEEERSEREDETSLVADELLYTAECAHIANELSTWSDRYSLDVTVTMNRLLASDELNADLAEPDGLAKYLMGCASDMVLHRREYLRSRSQKPWDEVQDCVGDRQKFSWKLEVEK